MSPDETKDPNAAPDFSSVPLPEANPIRSPYAPETGTLGDVADNLNNPTSAPSASSLAPESSSDPTPSVSAEPSVEIPTAGALSQPNSIVPKEKKSHKKLFLFGGIGLIVVAAIVVAVVLVMNGKNNNDDSGGNRNGNGKIGEVFATNAFYISNFDSQRAKYAFVDANGNKQGDFSFLYVNDFMDGYSLVNSSSGWGIIDENKNYTVNVDKCDAISVFGGLYGCIHNESEQNELIDGAGNLVLNYTNEFDNYDNFVLGGRSAYTIVKRGDNKYDLYNTRGALVESFESSTEPVISTINSNTKDSVTVLSYSGKIIIYSDNELKEIRHIDSSLSQKYFVVEISPDKETIILSTQQGEVEYDDVYGTFKMPEDNRLNAIIIGTKLREYTGTECSAVAYTTTSDNTGYAVCLNTSNKRLIKNDGEVETNLGLGGYGLDKNMSVIDANHYITGGGNATIDLYANGARKKRFDKDGVFYSGDAIGDVYVIHEMAYADSSYKQRNHKTALYDKDGNEVCTILEETVRSYDTTFDYTSLHKFDKNGLSVYSPYSGKSARIYNKQCEIVTKKSYSEIKKIGSYYTVGFDGKKGAIIDKDDNIIVDNLEYSYGLLGVRLVSPDHDIVSFTDSDKVENILFDNGVIVKYKRYIRAEDKYIYVKTHERDYKNKDDQGDTFAWYALDGKLIYGDEYK